MTPLAAELRAALERRGRTAKSVGEEIGIAYSSIYDISAGRIPTLTTAELIADALDWAPIATVTRELRTKTCEVCGAPFVDAGRNCTARCCSVECQRARHQRKVRGVVTVSLRGRAEIAENRLNAHQAAVLAMCMACSARTLICRQPACELRPVSPARLPERRVA